jgi:methylphosphotriester-DNA--protein-cysteine methyltransferase
MTENEKLRALLAEAREWVRTFGEAGCPADQCEECAAADEMVQRIDAALAEPVGECARCETLRDLADKAAWAQGDAQRRMIEEQKQRDEARAEVERLKESNRLLRHDADKEWGAAATAIAAAFRRGAEAMREAAMGAAWHSAAMGLHERIKEMPLPEDKR